MQTGFRVQSLLAYQRSKYHQMTRGFYKHLAFFISFYIMNGLVPVLICLIAARIHPFGIQYVASIGFITAIQLGFSQAALTVVISLLFLKKRKHPKFVSDDPSFYSAAIATIIIYSLVFVPLFIGSSWSYNRYAVNHINTVIGQDAAYMYIYALSGWIFANGLNLYFIMLIYEYRSKVLAGFLFLFSKLIVLGIGAAISLGVPNLTPDEAGGYLGLGLSVGGIIATLLTGTIALILTPLKHVFRKFTSRKMVFFLWGVFPQTAVVVSIQIIKAFALLIMGCSIQALLYQPAPISIQLTRTIWYNLMYLLPFATNGVMDCIFYYGLQTYDREIRVNEFVKIATGALIAAFALQLLVSIGLYYAIVPLGKFYAAINGAIPTAEWNKYFNVNNVDVPFVIQQIKGQSSWNTQSAIIYQALQDNSNGSLWESIYRQAYIEAYGPISQQVANAAYGTVYEKINSEYYDRILDGYIQKVTAEMEAKYHTTALPANVVQQIHASGVQYAKNDVLKLTKQYYQSPTVQSQIVVNTIAQTAAYATSQVNSHFNTEAAKVIMNSFTFGLPTGWTVPYGNDAANVSANVANASLQLGKDAGLNLHLTMYKTYVYLVIWTNLFSLGQGLNNISYVLKKRYLNIWEAIGTFGIQIVAIGVCVGVGVNEQEKAILPKMDAFTLPLCCAGIIVILWFSFIYGLTVWKVYRKNKNNYLTNYFNQAKFKKYFYYSFKI